MLVRVYYEDTDAAGVVYHASYLKFLERARTEFFRDRGFSVGELADSGNIFPVVRMEIDFRSPAKHDQLLEIKTAVIELKGSSILLKQDVLSATGAIICNALVRLACIGTNLKPHRIPCEVADMLRRELNNNE